MIASLLTNSGLIDFVIVVMFIIKVVFFIYAILYTIQFICIYESKRMVTPTIEAIVSSIALWIAVAVCHYLGR